MTTRQHNTKHFDRPFGTSLLGWCAPSAVPSTADMAGPAPDSIYMVEFQLPGFEARPVEMPGGAASFTLVIPAPRQLA